VVVPIVGVGISPPKVSLVEFYGLTKGTMVGVFS